MAADLVARRRDEVQVALLRLRVGAALEAVACKQWEAVAEQSRGMSRASITAARNGFERRWFDAYAAACWTSVHAEHAAAGLSDNGHLHADTEPSLASLCCTGSEPSLPYAAAAAICPSPVATGATCAACHRQFRAED